MIWQLLPTKGEKKPRKNKELIKYFNRSIPNGVHDLLEFHCTRPPDSQDQRIDFVGRESWVVGKWVGGKFLSRWRAKKTTAPETAMAVAKTNPGELIMEDMFKILVLVKISVAHISKRPREHQVNQTLSTPWFSLLLISTSHNSISPKNFKNPIQ